MTSRTATGEQLDGHPRTQLHPLPRIGGYCVRGRLVGSAAVPRATRRLQALMSGGWSMFGSRMDTYGRRLVVVAIADGRDAGRVLIDEGLAQSSPNLGESLVLTPSILAIADPTRMRTTLRRRRQDSARPRSRRYGTAPAGLDRPSSEACGCRGGPHREVPLPRK